MRRSTRPQPALLLMRLAIIVATLAYPKLASWTFIEAAQDFSDASRRLGCSWSNWEHKLVCTGDDEKKPKYHTAKNAASRGGAAQKKQVSALPKGNKCAWDTTHNRCKPVASENFPVAPPLAKVHNDSWTKGQPKRLAILISGQSARGIKRAIGDHLKTPRPNCSPQARRRQINAIKTQHGCVDAFALQRSGTYKRNHIW